MKVKQKAPKKKIWIIIVSAVVLLAGLGLTYYVFAQGGNSTPPSSGQTKSTDTSSGDIPNTTNDPNKVTPPNSDKPAQTQVDESSGKRVIPVVTSVTVDGSVVYIRGGVNTPETEGSCYALLTGPNSQSIQKDTTLLPSASTADCKTISIPTSELTAGKWSYTLNFTSSSAKGQSSVGTFVIS